MPLKGPAVGVYHMLYGMVKHVCMTIWPSAVTPVIVSHCTVHGWYWGVVLVHILNPCKYQPTDQYASCVAPVSLLSLFPQVVPFCRPELGVYCVGVHFLIASSVSILHPCKIPRIESVSILHPYEILKNLM